MQSSNPCYSQEQDIEQKWHITPFNLGGMQLGWYLHREGASRSSFHQTYMSCVLILRPNRSQADTYRWACSRGMAVQWLAHQTGPVAPAGCSGGLEEGRKKEGGRSRLNWAEQKERERGELLICAGREIWKVTDKKEEYHSGGAKVFMKNTGRLGMRDQTGLYVNKVMWNLLKGVFST